MSNAGHATAIRVIFLKKPVEMYVTEDREEERKGVKSAVDLCRVRDFLELFFGISTLTLTLSQAWERGLKKDGHLPGFGESIKGSYFNLYFGVLGDG